MAENESFAQHSESFAQYSDPLADHSEPLADRSEPLADHFDPLADHSESLATQAKKEAERKHIDSTINTAASVLAKATTTAEDKLVAEITDILQAAERKESRVCNDYLHQLQELCNTTISSIEKKILVLAAMDTNLDHRLQQLDSLSLDAIASIKDKTIQISEYSNNIFPHLHQRISNDIHAVTKQLDEIRINLQEEIGREWPYLDYDWAKYHALRTDLHSRQKEFVEFLELQTKPAHSNLEEIPINVQDQIDEISSLAFKKIEMVQFVGAKKIRTKDTKNDFPQNYMSFTESVYENIKAAPGVAVSKASQAIYGVQETFGPEEIYEKYIGSAADFIQSAANAAGQAGQAAYQEGIEYIKENVVPAAAETGQNSGQGGQAAFEKAEFAKENVLPLVSEYAQDASKQIKSQANAATEAVQSKGEQIREKISSAALGPIAESRSSAATEPGFVEHAISGFDQKVDETTHFAQHIVQDLKDKTDQVYEKASDFIDKAPAADILPKNVDDKVLKAKVFIPSSDPERNSKSPRAQKFDGEL
ncbi:hypothetical protein NEOLI_000080 [Neolecta irregularis DAH-3]|uniref:Uncharacterized protein n=1 Tax=Neolecta irregularis (strain DAH-3) TaxID=1198029 RepID=A0A1U7LVI0_NEOID|nr:hypothetical protein NEOLI_000080 [Neolecta irregularis DAH-3]|eukprot:OLL26628.1 hypothetical protein NEOLI_000080 [Neolecta irregularis DAH-3]